MPESIHAPLWPVPPWRALPTPLNDRCHRFMRRGDVEVPLTHAVLLTPDGPLVPLFTAAALEAWHAGLQPRGRSIVVRGSDAELDAIGRSLVDAFGRHPESGAHAVHRLRGRMPSEEHLRRAKFDLWGRYCAPVEPDAVKEWLAPRYDATLVLGAVELLPVARALHRRVYPDLVDALDGCALVLWRRHRGSMFIEVGVRLAEVVAEHVTRAAPEVGVASWSAEGWTEVPSDDDGLALTGDGPLAHLAAAAPRRLTLRSAWVDVDALAELPSLEALDADGPVWSLSSVRGLRSLVLATEPLRVDSLADLPYLDRYEVDRPTREGLAAVSRAPRLRRLTLTLYGPELDLDDIPALPSIEALTLRTYARPPIDLAPLARATRLRSLGLLGVDVTSAEAVLSLPLDSLAIESDALDLLRLAEHPTLRALDVGTDTPDVRELQRRRPDLAVTVCRPWFDTEDPS
ncbi:MAG: hypothetical protein R3B09_09590 [Nannocystaceae bacterium]